MTWEIVPDDPFWMFATTDVYKLFQQHKQRVKHFTDVILVEHTQPEHRCPCKQYTTYFHKETQSVTPTEF